jgi:O-antigen/teichoic acid export membrane protein
LLLLSRLYYDFARCVFLVRRSLGLMMSIDLIFNAALLLLFLGISFYTPAVSVLYLLICHIVAGVTASLFGLLQYRPHVGSFTVRPNKEVRRFAAMSGTNSILLFFYSQADVMLAGLMLSPAAVGLYSGGRSLIRVGYLAIEAVNAMSLATASAFVNSANAPRLSGYVTSLVAVGLCITTPMALVFAVGSPNLIRVIFGEAYIGSAQVATILCVGFLLFSVSCPTASALDALSKPIIPLYAKVAGLSVTTVGSYLLAGSFGARGIAGASVAGIAIIALIQTIGFLLYRRPQEVL